MDNVKKISELNETTNINDLFTIGVDENNSSVKVNLGALVQRILGQIPTKTSQLDNDKGFIVNETDPTIPNGLKSVTDAIAMILNGHNTLMKILSGVTAVSDKGNITSSQSTDKKINELSSNVVVTLDSLNAWITAMGGIQRKLTEGDNITIDAQGRISASGGMSSVNWGDIQGTLSSQNDLSLALGGKVGKSDRLFYVIDNVTSLKSDKTINANTASQNVPTQMTDKHLLSREAFDSWVKLAGISSSMTKDEIVTESNAKVIVSITKNADGTLSVNRTSGSDFSVVNTATTFWLWSYEPASDSVKRILPSSLFEYLNANCGAVKTSSTTGATIEFVTELPSTTDNNVIYLVEE